MRPCTVVTTAGLWLLAVPSFAQSTGLSNQNVGARVLVPISITRDHANGSQVEGQDLYFGRFLSPSSPGTVTLSPANLVSSTGGVSGVLDHTTPRYNVSATNRSGMTVSIQFPPVVSNGAQTMALDNPTFAVQDAPGPGLASGGRFTFNTSTSNFFRIGGRLSVNANQADGLYTNTYTVTVAYN